MLDIDMELIRRIAVLKDALGSSGGDPSEAESALAHVRDRLTDAEPAVARGLEWIETTLGREGATPERQREAVELIERVVIDDDADARAALADIGSAADAGTPAPSAAVVSGEGSEDDSMHSLAAYLVQMEPTLMDSLTVLRDRFTATLEQWDGSAEVRGQLESALGELDAVTSNKRSRRTKRAEVVERVGEALEVALLEDEDRLMMEEPAVEDPSAPPAEGEEPEPAIATRSDSATHSATDSATDSESVTETAPADLPGPTAEAAPGLTVSDGVGGASQSSSDGLAPDVAQRFPEPRINDADPELVVDFVAEGLEYLDHAEEALLTLEARPDDAEAVNVVFRAFHTIKGVSAFLELTQVSNIAHEAETLLAQVREGSLRFTESAADLFLTSADVLRRLLLNIREITGGGSPPPPTGLHTLIETLIDPTLAEKVATNQSLALGPKPSDEAGEAEDAPEARESAGSGDDSVRIRTERLDALVDLVGELVVSYSMISQDRDIVGNRGSLQKKVSHANKIIRELQDLSTSLRMVPLKPSFHKVSRVVRDVSRKSGKDVNFITHGEETELDRSMVAIITDPLVHMVRNSIDHGIEPADERRAAGKPARGTVRLKASQMGGNVVVEIHDDGRGLDREKLLKKAVDQGVVAPDRTLSDQETLNLVFHPGLSTAAEVTDISGRGVGMDVVKRAIESLRGRVEIQSEPGQGTTFLIYLPLTLAITDGMLVRVGDERYIVPTMKIQVSLRPTREHIWTVSGRGEMVMLHGSLVPIARMHKLFQLQGAKEDPTEALLVVVGEGSRRTALLVDELLGQQQFVVKPLTGQVAHTDGVAGGAVLGDGGVGLILDPEEIIDLARGSATRSDAA